MNLNRHNYEEFFLLYVDNELSAADRKAVELFVQENADLEAELNMLQQTVFNADDVVFDNKASLLKEEITALQQNLLLYIDNELSPADKLTTEKLLRTDIAAGKELSLLQQTKLEADTAIVFADKKSLYRKEGGRVVALPWRRIAAAAILLGFGTWATVTFIKTDKTEGRETAGLGQTKTNAPKQTGNTITAATPALPQQQTTVEANPVTANTNDGVKQAAQKNDQQLNNGIQQRVDEKQNDNIVVAKEDIKKLTNNLPKPYSENINKPERNEIITADVTPKNTATEIKSGIKTPVVDVNKNDVEVNGYALNANYTDDNAGNSLSPDDSKGKKTKLGGFFRKVKRLVERNTEDESGNGIKVAGFDIAIK
ncbi:hypothetical protein [Ferruginibacter profundus]